MQFHPHHSESPQRRYPWLSLFDVTLNVVLCGGVLALACVLVGIVLSHNGSRIIGQIGQLLPYLWR